MKIKQVNIKYFEKGDRVLTSNGKGTVVSDNIEELDYKLYNSYNSLQFFHKVSVQLDESHSNNTNNALEEFEVSTVLLDTEEIDK